MSGGRGRVGDVEGGRGRVGDVREVEGGLVM